MTEITVAELEKNAPLAGITLKLISGAQGLSRKISSPLVQRPGVALTGYLEFLHHDRILVLGRAEVDYLLSLSPQKQQESLSEIFQVGIPTLIIATQEEFTMPESWKIASETWGIPVFHSPAKSRLVIQLLSDFLEIHLSESFHLHGVLLEILELGVLILGRSGIGKSESALDLVNRGHRLVADDLIEIRRSPRGVLLGRSVDPIRYHMEIRGLGIINIKDLFGVSAVREEKSIDLVIELVDWEAGEEYDRLGLEEHTWESLGVKIPSVKIPVSPGRNIATIIEVAARNQVLKKMGYHSARKLQQSLSQHITEPLTGEKEKKNGGS